ncbi:MAG TPA: LysR family transcriptional regulator, partial [Ramlibacter sp.]|nr:LysR family transcriptional regulator [Ramlibacter sp.]
METKWLEDFVSLAETRSFSRSAQLRHVTQPAFSRRIQALEAWAGTDLVDRSSYPTRLTPAGETLYAQAMEMLQALQSTRAMLRGHSSGGQDVLEIAVPHTLAFTFFPQWVSRLREQFGPIRSRLIALNVHDAAMRLVEGGCDLLIAYHHAALPLQLDPERYQMVTLGQELLAPYC